MPDAKIRHFLKSCPECSSSAGFSLLLTGLSEMPSSSDLLSDLGSAILSFRFGSMADFERSFLRASSTTGFTDVGLSFRRSTFIFGVSSSLEDEDDDELLDLLLFLQVEHENGTARSTYKTTAGLKMNMKLCTSTNDKQNCLKQPILHDLDMNDCETPLFQYTGTQMMNDTNMRNTEIIQDSKQHNIVHEHCSSNNLIKIGSIMIPSQIILSAYFEPCIYNQTKYVAYQTCCLIFSLHYQILAFSVNDHQI